MRNVKKDNNKNMKNSMPNGVQKGTHIHTIKIISMVCIIILIANILLFSFRVYDALIMWIIIVIIAMIAFPGMKLLRKMNLKK